MPSPFRTSPRGTNRRRNTNIASTPTRTKEIKHRKFPPLTTSHPGICRPARPFESALPQESFGVQFIGSEGVITTSYNSLTLSQHPRESEPGYTIGTFPLKTQKEFLAEHHKKYPVKKPSADSLRPNRRELFEPKGFNAHLEHHKNFYNAVRTRKPFFEDAVFGYRAAGPALLTNVSYFERRICEWNPESMTA